MHTGDCGISSENLYANAGSSVLGVDGQGVTVADTVKSFALPVEKRNTLYWESNLQPSS